MAASHPVDGRAALARGNHLAAQNDEPEPQHPALTQFTRWYESTGHWIYNGRAQAVWTWITRGISRMPDAPPGAAAALEQWVREDPFTAADLAEDFKRFAFSEAQLLQADLERDTDKGPKLAARNDAQALAAQVMDVDAMRRAGWLP